jgi:hypothetical protein
MVGKDSSFNEFMGKPLVKAILRELTKEELTIPQLMKKLDIDDYRLLVAYVTELQYQGLVIPIIKENNQELREGNQFKDLLGSDLLINSQTKWKTPLGISISDYNRIWQNISEDKKIDDLKSLNSIIFTISAPLKQKLKENIEMEEE